MNTKRFVGLLLITFLLSLSGCDGDEEMPETSNIAVIDGEDAGTTPWEFDALVEEGSNTLALDASAKNNGVSGYKGTLNNNNDRCYGVKSLSGADVFLRSYVYFPSSDYPYSQSETPRIGKWFSIRSSTQELAAIWLSFGSGGITKYRFSYYYTEATSEELSGALSLGAWHYIELHYKVHALDGIAELLIDGEEIISIPELNTGGNIIASAWLGQYYGYYPGDITNGEYFYLDDIVANTTGPIGPYAESETTKESLVAKALIESSWYNLTKQK
jgi:hypothetical protein